jgi:type II secretion system protein C
MSSSSSGQRTTAALLLANDQSIKPLSFIISAILLLLKIVAAGLLAGLIWQSWLVFFAPLPSAFKPIVSINSATTPAPVASLPSSVTQIFSQAELGQKSSVNKKPIMAEEVVTEKQAKVKILGLVLPVDGNKAMAILSVDGAKQKIFRIGDTISDNMRLLAIFPKELLVQQGQKRLRIMLDQSPQTASADGRNDYIPEPTFSRQLEIKKDLRKTLLRYPDRLPKYVQISPVRSDGVIAGYSLRKGVNGQAFEASGLKDGDIVTHIENQFVGTMSLGKLLGSGLISKERIPVTIKREGVSRKLELIIQ